MIAVQVRNFSTVFRNLRNPKYICNLVRKSNRRQLWLTTQRLEHTSASNFSDVENKTDIEKLFINEQVQSILKKMTRVDLEKVFRPVQQSLSEPKYQFYTDEEFQKLLNEAKLRAEEKLQMPPVLNPRKPIEEVISKDPEIQGYSTVKFVFCDIGSSTKDRDRLIVVREPNGLLRKASWEERLNMNQIYFPSPGRKLIRPKMFEDEHLEDVLNTKCYEFILSQTCAQFEPDDPEYIRIMNKIYGHITKTRSFEVLRSTRFFGPLVFNLVVQKNIDGLLLHLIEQEIIEDSVDLVALYHIVHPECDSANNCPPQTDEIQFLMHFVEKDSVKKSHLELALQTIKELRLQNKIVNEGIKKAHGQT